MKAHTIAVATIILLLMVQISSRGQSPSDQTITSSSCPAAGIAVHRISVAIPPLISNSDCYEANSVSRCGPCERQYYYPPVTPAARSDRPEFVYRMTLTNDGAKIVRAVEWEYVFADPETQAEVARHQFYSQQRVRPNETKTLTEYSTSPPTKVISVKALSRPETDRFTESVVIKRIVYEDGSVWVLQLQPK
jgi:hypothetical protein